MKTSLVFWISNKNSDAFLYSIVIRRLIEIVYLSTMIGSFVSWFMDFEQMQKGKTIEELVLLQDIIKKSVKWKVSM